MLRILAFLCCLQLAAGAAFSCQILLDGDAAKSIRVPEGSTALVSLQDTSIADAKAIIIKEIRLEGILSLPHRFEMEYPDNLPAGRTYTFSVRITHGFDLLFANDMQLLAPVHGDSPATLNLAVKNLGRVARSVPEEPAFSEFKEKSWPEMVGWQGADAVAEIKKQTGFTDVFTVRENSPLTMDYRSNRVRVIVNSSGVVTVTPRTG